MTIHELLVYLPHQSVTTETVAMLAGSFKNLYAKYAPSTLLGSVFNALEFDFMELLEQRLPDLREIVLDESRNIVLQLPACDRECPAASAVLAHELGHAIDLEHGFSITTARGLVADESAATFRLLSNWMGEVAADFVAAEATGCASMLALVALEYCLLPISPIHELGLTHPLSIWRLRLVRAYLESRAATPRELAELDREIEFYGLAFKYSVWTSALPEADAEGMLKQYEIVFVDVMQPLAKVLGEKIAGLGLRDFRLTGDDLERCLSRLGRDLPIAAQGESRPALRQALAEYRERPEKTPEVFKALTIRFSERPLGVSEILLAAHCARLRVVGEFVGAREQDPRALAQALRRIDALISSSIKTSQIHLGLIARVGSQTP